MPTVAFHFRKVRKGNVTMKIWDLAGAFIVIYPGILLLSRYRSAQVSSTVVAFTQANPFERYRSIWDRYCNGVDAVV